MLLPKTNFQFFDLEDFLFVSEESKSDQQILDLTSRVNLIATHNSLNAFALCLVLSVRSG